MKKWILFSLLLAGLMIAAFFQLPSRVISDEITPLDYPQLLLAAQSLPNTGFIKQGRGSIVVLRTADDYTDKLYGILLNYLTPNEKKYLTISPRKAHITLFRSHQRLKFSKNNYTFQVNGIVKETIIKKSHGLLIRETWYEVAISSTELTQFFKEIPHPNSLHISIAVSKKLL